MNHTSFREHNKLQIHYYFDDNSHTMDADVRNKAEAELLKAIKRIGELLEQTVRIETEAYSEGGLIETLLIVLPVAHYLSPSVNSVITHYFTKDADIDELDKKIKQETLKGLQLDNAQKEHEFSEEIDLKLSDRLVARYVSNYYKKIDSYEKIASIGYSDIDNPVDEVKVEKNSFKNFILVDDTTVSVDDEAIVEIISPVLKEGRFSWRGKYKNEKIDFSMGDNKFKEEVIEGRHKFSNGSSIYCSLKITITFDEFGDEKRRSYSAQEVYGVQELSIGELKLRESGKQKKRDKWREEHQARFDFGEEEANNG